jgi:AcrR family transcriptional regulator
VTRETAKARTRERLLAEAQRLFRERGYAATSLEQIAEAAEVTKGAIYGHFSSKEDLLLSALEAAPTPEVDGLNDLSRPLRDRLAEHGQARARAWAATDRTELAADLEFLAALLRSPAARARYGHGLAQRLGELAAEDKEEPLPGTTPLQVWAIGYALDVGLSVFQGLAPEVYTPEVLERAYGLIAGLYPGDEIVTDEATSAG